MDEEDVTEEDPVEVKEDVKEAWVQSIETVRSSTHPGSYPLMKPVTSSYTNKINVTGVQVNNIPTAQLLDSGNLVLFQGQNKDVYSWQSFDYPSNTFLPGMKIRIDRKTGLNRVFTSWKSSVNPGVGDYSHKMELVGSPQLFLYQGVTKIWRTGSWTGQGWSGIPEMSANYFFNVSYINNDDWSAPKDQCDGYNHCGPFGLCDPCNTLGAFECVCYPGYEAQSQQDWYLRDGSRGCKMKVGTQL
ncbi:hypothetical protein E3N88_32838 [Mikania micrantha]|uniref:Bulb-type lectin domain-containing protein n=1 Tax=Mikania micrantha TaxID=192012 RepID=A0A5N6MC78_9ASTR|nr:hypothetical protein E3N88_32838 [Mikania micrantha]